MDLDHLMKLITASRSLKTLSVQIREVQCGSEEVRKELKYAGPATYDLASFKSE